MPDAAPPPVPRLRPLDIVPVQQGGQPMILLRDPSGLSANAVMVSAGMLAVLRLLDGQQTLRGMQTALARQTGEFVTSRQLERIIEQLDEALLLESPRLEAHRAARLAEYRPSGVRPCVHAEGGYPSEPQAFAEVVDGWARELPPLEPGPDGRVVGVIAPHIDFGRGGTTYAHAYRDLVAHCDADLFVILGTDHHGSMQFSATRNDFETPLGRVRVSRDALVALDARFIGDLYEGELQHLGEHTIEFQVVLLRHFLAQREFEIVPLLCGGLGEDIEAGESTPQDAEVLSMVECLQQLVASGRRVCLIASADLSHVGPRFGDNRRLTPSYLASVEEHDRAVLEHAIAGRADAMFAAVSTRRNDTNICGLAPIYLMLKALGDCRGALLDYRQATSPDGQQSVTFAAATFRQS